MTRVEKATGRCSFVRSVWDATSDGVPGSSAVEPNSSYDVIVVGGGVAGAVAFATLASAGVRVALLEAHRLASGATGRSGGFIVPTFSAISPRSVLQTCGDHGEQLVSAVARSADFVFDLAREYEIHCAAGQQGWYQPAVSASKLQELEADAEVWRRFGGKPVLFDGPETERFTGVRGYAGSCRFESGGTIHPVKFVHGLVRAAVARGGHYLEHTPVLSMRRTGGRWYVETTGFNVSAEKVLICTNGQSGSLTPALSRSLIRVVVCQSASYPIADSDRDHLFGQGSCLSDSQVNLFTYRFDPDWRLISGCFPLLLTGDGSRLGNRIARRLRKVLEIPAPVRQEYVWFGRASITEDFLPKVCELGPGAYSFTACNGRGLALSSVLAHYLSNALLTGSHNELPVHPSSPTPYKCRALAGLGVRLYPVYGAIADRFSATVR